MYTLCVLRLSDASGVKLQGGRKKDWSSRRRNPEPKPTPVFWPHPPKSQAPRGGGGGTGKVDNQGKRGSEKKKGRPHPLCLSENPKVRGKEGVRGKEPARNNKTGYRLVIFLKLRREVAIERKNEGEGGIINTSSLTCFCVLLKQIFGVLQEE